MMNFLASSILLSFLKWTSADMTNEETTKKYSPCLDSKGIVVTHGDRFFPLGSDPCTQCTCLDGKPEMCIAVFCSPPENCRQYHALSDKCCEFVCLDRDFPLKNGNGTYSDLDTLSTTNLGLRLVASTVTSFLILALLLFMIHRLRQRRLLLMIRRFHARRMENGNSHLSRRYSEDDDGSVGYFVGHDQLDFSRYDEPPPPYTLWKPPEMYIPPGEAPPPYDLSVQLTAPYTSNGRYTYSSSNGQVGVTQQAIISVHAENQPSPDVVTATTSSSAAEHNQINNMETTAEIEVSNLVNSNDSAVLPPDIQYEETCCYRNCCSQADASTVLQDAQEDNVPETNAAVVSTGPSVVCENEAVASTSSCNCATITKKGKSYKRHSCSEFPDQNRSRANVGRNSPDKRFSLNPSASQENNNLYPDPTAWGEVSESSSSSSPTYDQPTLSPSTSDSSSADADFPRDSRLKHVLNNSISCSMMGNNRTGVAAQDLSFENSRPRDLCDDISKPQNFQKTLSNLKKFSLIKRKKKKRRVERHSEISCSFVCQSIPDGMHPSQMVFEDGLDLTARSTEGINARPLEAINPHIGHKLASSGLRGQVRPTSINIPGQPYRHSAGLDDEAGPSFLSTFSSGKVSSVVTVSGRNLDGNCVACRNTSSPDSICEDHRSQGGESNISQHTNSLGRQGISRSGSICSETGERRHHRSAGSSPAMPSRSIHYDSPRYMDRSDNRYASSSHITFSDRTIANGIQRVEVDDSTVRRIPVWIVNSVAMPSRLEYESSSAHASTIPRSASASFREGSHSVGDITSPLDFRDSMLSSGSSWEACSHL